MRTTNKAPANTAMTVDQMIELQNKINEVMAQFATDNNLTASNAIVTGTNNGFDLKMSFATQDANPSGVDPRYLKDLQRNGWTHGLTEAMLNTKFAVRTSKKGEISDFKFVGMRATRVLATNAEGILMGFAADAVAPIIIRSHHTGL